MVEGEYNLIEAAKAGNAQAFGILYDAYLPPIYRFIYLKVGRKETAEDLTHEVFLSAWQNLKSYAHRGFPFSTWLYKISRNRVIDHYRTSHPAVTLAEEMEEYIELVNAPTDEIDRSLTMETIMSAIEKLPEEHQTILIMRFVDDAEPSEIAEVVGKSVGAVRVMQHRALQEVKNILKKSKPD